MSNSIDIRFNNNREVIVSAAVGNAEIGNLDAWLVLDELQINNVFVQEMHRRQGIATEMINQLIDFGHSHNCKKITLEVRENNISARKLYEKLGFCQVGERKNYYQDNNETAILMDRNI